MRKDNKELLAKTYLQAYPSKANPGKFNQAGGAATLILNKKSAATDEAMQIARMILSPERYPAQLEKAGSYWFPIMKNYNALPFFTQDEYNKQVTENIVPWLVAPFADGGLSPIYSDITISANKDMLQAVSVQNKSPQEALKLWADAADKAKAKFAKK